MEKELHILILEDIPADAELMERELRKGGIIFSSKKVDTKKTFLKELKEFAPDLILGDYSLPSFNGLTALAIVQEKCPDIPFIFVSGSIGEELAIETLKRGATDYVLKDRLSRLVPGVNRALREIKERTERKQAEMELNKERDRAQRYLDIAGVMLVAININQEVILINRKGCEILGYEEGEIIGRNWFDHFIPERDRKSVKEVFAKLVAAEIEPVEHFENTVLTKSGMEKIIAWHNTIITDEYGHIMGTLSSGEDITDRKRAEKSLQESEKRYREVVENATEIIYTVDEKGNFTYANPAGLKATGYSLQELRKLNYANLVLPEHRERVSQIYINQLRQKLPNTYVEFPFLGKTGEIIWFGQNSTIVIEGNKIVGFHIIARDVTERKQAEEALRESEERYRILVETSPDAITLLDLNLNIIMANQPALKLYGHESAEEIKGKNGLDYLVLEERGRALEDMGQILETGSMGPIEYMLVKKDGSPFPAELKASLVLDSQRKPGGIILVSRDITERKNAEEALRQSEERFRELFDDAPVGYFEYDVQGNITNVNRTEFEMLGYTPEEMIGQPPWKFIVEEEQAHHAMMAKLAGKMPPGKGFERTYRRKDGSTFPALCENRLLRNAEGEITGIRGTIQDITERKRAEEALHASEAQLSNALKIAYLGHWEYDVASDLFTFSDHFYSIFRTTAEREGGYTMPSAQYAQRFVHPDDRSVVGVETQKALETTDPHFSRQLEHRMIYADGEVGYIAVRFFIVKDDHGRTVKTYGVNQDITERKRTEQEMASLQDQLRQSQKMEAIGQLAGGVAHDFNNILTVIKGYSQLSLTEMKEEDPFRENIEEIKKSADLAANLTRQLLAFSRRQIMEMKILDLNDLIKNLDKMLRRVIGEDIELVTLLTEDLGRVNADPGQIEQVIMNLAVNARDAMSKGGKLTIETADVELDEEYTRAHIAVKPGAYVMLSVSDSGMGMTQEVRDRVFEPFFTMKEKGKGTGLGLSTVYGIVKQSGGNIWVYSEPGKGTTFKVYLPRVDEPLGEIKEKVVEEELPRGSETILIVEDGEDVLKLAGRILNRQGYTVLETTNGSEALRICKEEKQPIHLILTDVVMPQMSGRELIERCREVRQDFKAIYMSGYTDNTITHHGILEKGMNYIQKPFTIEILTRKVRQVLDE
jgi:PAS domain S-box-containing protein